MNIIDDFGKFARSKHGISSLGLHKYTTTTGSYISPTIIEERQLNVASMDVFSRLMMDRIIFLGLPIDDYVANIIQAQLLYLDSSDPGKDIQIYFNTPGGSVNAGLGIYDTMQYIKPDVSTFCMGQAASMGSLLLAAGAKGKRYSLPNSRIMIHQPSGGYQGQATDIEIHTNEILRVKNRLNQIYEKHTGNPLSKIKKMMERDKFLDPEEARRIGLIDKTISKRQDIINIGVKQKVN